MTQTIDGNKRAHHGAGAPGSIGGQFAAQRSAEYGTDALAPSTSAAPAGRGHLRMREDGRLEVADTADANRAYGCQADDDCILANEHGGDCHGDRESWAGPDTDYPERERRNPGHAATEVLAREGIVWTQMRSAHEHRKTVLASGITKLMADAVSADRVGSPFAAVPAPDSIERAVDDVVRESYADYGAKDMCTPDENLQSRIRRQQVSGDELARLLRRAIIVDRARRLGVDIPEVDYTGPMTEDKRRANTAAGGTYFTPAELSDMERTTKKCRGCSRGISAYDEFPGDVCIECHERTAAQDLPTEAQVADMWRR